MKDAVVAASTVKADLDQVERFVERNLAGGADHVMVFLDDANPPVRQMLEAHPHVSVVRTGKKYWNNDRPPRVSDRLRINMNLANAVLATVPSVGWMVSVDSDEAVCIDRDALAQVEGDAVLLAVLEAVAQRTWPRDEPTLFKKRPTDGELAALSALGSIYEPDLASYFRGHQEGKPAVRPSLRIRLRVHSAADETGKGLARWAPGLNVLHYESHSLDDFIRRWRDYAPSIAHLRTHRDERKRIGVALHTLYHHETLNDRQRDKLIKKLFDREVADDLATLQKLGLAAPAPERRSEARPLPTAEVDQVARLLEGLMPADKHVFNDGGTPEEIAAEVAAAGERMAESGPEDQSVANVRDTVDRFHQGSEHG